MSRQRLGHDGAGLIPRRSGSTEGAWLVDLVLFVAANLANALGAVGVAASSRSKQPTDADAGCGADSLPCSDGGALEAARAGDGNARDGGARDGDARWGGTATRARSRIDLTRFDSI